MDERTKEKITDVIGSIAAAPVVAGSKIVETAHKIADKSPALDSMGEEIGSRANKAIEAISETAKKISESDTTKNIKDKIEQMSYVDKSAKVKDAFEKTQTAVREFADTAGDKIADNAQKAKEGLSGLKENIQERREAAESADNESCMTREAEGFFEEDNPASEAAEEFFEEEVQAAEEPVNSAGEAGCASEEAAEKEKPELSFDDKVKNIEDSVNGFVEKAAYKIEDVADDVKAAVEKFEDKLK